MFNNSGILSFRIIRLETLPGNRNIYYFKLKPNKNIKYYFFIIHIILRTNLENLIDFIIINCSL